MSLASSGPKRALRAALPPNTSGSAEAPKVAVKRVGAVIGGGKAGITVKTPFERMKEKLIEKGPKTPSGRPDWAQLFKKFDTSGDGSLNMNEFLNGVRKTTGYDQKEISDADIYQMFNMNLADNSRSLLSDDFVWFLEKSPLQYQADSLITRLKRECGDNLRGTFARMDSDGSGEISRNEFRKVVREVAKIQIADMSNDTMDEIFMMMCKPGQSEAELDDFMKWIVSDNRARVVAKKEQEAPTTVDSAVVLELQSDIRELKSQLDEMKAKLILAVQAKREEELKKDETEIDLEEARVEIIEQAKEMQVIKQDKQRVDLENQTLSHSQATNANFVSNLMMKLHAAGLGKKALSGELEALKLRLQSVDSEHKLLLQEKERKHSAKEKIRKLNLIRNFCFRYERHEILQAWKMWKKTVHHVGQAMLQGEISAYQREKMEVDAARMEEAKARKQAEEAETR
jgi:Ca2+-binding EF-hand superfamily protein